MPKKPAEKSFEQVVALLKPNEIAEFFQFNMRDREDVESLSQYLAELRRLTEHCDYGDQCENILRDPLVYEIKHEHIQQRLLT